MSSTPRARASRPSPRRDLALLAILTSHVAGAVERLRAMAALRESGDLYRAYFTASPLALFVVGRARPLPGGERRGLRAHGLRARAARRDVDRRAARGRRRAAARGAAAGADRARQRQQRDPDPAPRRLGPQLPGARLDRRRGPRALAAARHHRPQGGRGEAARERGALPRPVGGGLRGDPGARRRAHRGREPRAVRAHRLLLARARRARRLRADRTRVPRDRLPQPARPSTRASTRSRC